MLCALNSARLHFHAFATVMAINSQLYCSRNMTPQLCLADFSSRPSMSASACAVNRKCSRPAWSDADELCMSCDAAKTASAASVVVHLPDLRRCAARRSDLGDQHGGRESLCSCLLKNATQFVEVDRFSEMEIKAGFSAAANVFVCAKSGEGDAFDSLFAFRLGDDLIAAAIREANVAQNDVEHLRPHDFQGAPGAISLGNVMTEMLKEAR